MESYSLDIESLPTISLEEVAKHAAKPDTIWTVVDNLVYDITPFVPVHPGGKKILLGAGKEASDLFHRHHKGVDLPRTKLSKLCIGRLCCEGEEPTYVAPTSIYANMSFLGDNLF